MRGVPFALSIGGIMFLLTMIWGGPFVEIMRRLRIGRQIQITVPGISRTRMGTPTMGGLLVVLPVVAVMLMLAVVDLLGRNVTGRSISLPVSVLFAYGALGAYRDWKSVPPGRLIGPRISPGVSVALEFVLAAGGAAFLMFALDIHSLAVPTIPVKFDLGLVYLPIAILTIVGVSNGIRVMDDLDGLAGIVVTTGFIAYGVVALLQGQIFLVGFCFAVVGACFAFLWYNVMPAQLRFGLTGSLALGATLGTVALMTGQWLILPVIAAVPAVELASILLHRAYKLVTRLVLGEERRLFRLSPLHRHFALMGWSETQIVQRFWMAAILSAMLGIALALV